MQLTKPIHITAVGSSILVGLVAIILCILKWTHTIELSWVVLIGIVLGTGVISLILFAYLINRFVSRKIKFIYSIITNRQELDANDFSLSEEAMGKLTQDTANWAKIQKKQIKDLKKQAAFRKEFLGNLAHELKTPVFSIQGYILTLLEGGLEDERVNRDFLVRALSGVDRISNLLDDLDEIARFETDRFNLKIQKFDMVQLVREVFEELESKANKKAIKLEFKRHYEPMFVMGDKKRLTQVLVNLVSNSISYGVNDGKTTIATSPVDKKTIRVEVIDNGVGMSEEHIPRLFERFYRVDKSRERHVGGSGLGLAIVKHVIEAHKQSLDVKSTEGVGSTFSFTVERA
jgi:two-component system phosphate regulon sensor histidine kinase PhoR